VSDHVAEPILRLDWLTINNALWDFKNSKIYLNGVEYEILPKPPTKWCRRIVVQGDQTLMPRSENEFTGRVLFSTMDDA